MDGQLTPLGELTDILYEDNHTMLLLPNAQTARMYYLVKEKLPLFQECSNRFALEASECGYTMKIHCY